MRRKVRILRHWKQRFDRNAKFVWRRSLIYSGERYWPGDPIPDLLAGNKAKLRRFWESGTIELAQFEEPNVLTGQTSTAEDMAHKLEEMRARDEAQVAAEVAVIEDRVVKATAEVMAAEAATDFLEAEDEEFDPSLDRDGDWLNESDEPGPTA